MWNRFVGQAFDDEGRNLLDGLECFWNITVVAELPCGKQFFDECTPRKFVGGVHCESCGFEVVPRIEQEAPVFVTGNNGGFPGYAVGCFLGGNV